MHVSVVIVGFRNRDDVAACLTALGAQTYDDFDVVVCENGGAEATERLQDSLPSRLPAGQAVTIFDAGGNLGFAGGVNAGIARARAAEAWWVLNPDTQPEPGALAALVARLSKGDCEAVGGVLLLPDGTVQSYGGLWQASFARPVSIGHGARGSDRPDPGVIEPKLSYLSGASMLIGRAFHERIGPMKEDYFLYCEEVDWCLRALRAGLRLGFAPEARVRHASGTTTGADGPPRARTRLAVYLNERNKILLTADLFADRLGLAALAVLALVAKRYLLAGAPRQFGYGVAGLIAGLRGRRGPPPWMAVA